MGQPIRRLPHLEWKGAAQRDVDQIRSAAEVADAKQDPEFTSLVVRMLGRRVAAALNEQHTDVDLREWHRLALDIAAGLSSEADRVDLSLVISGLRASITMAERNPADRLASRPASRRVLIALRDLGVHGRHSYSKVRDLAGHGQSHFSNILRVLHAHGFVNSDVDSNDGRERCLWLTEQGRQAIDGQEREHRRTFTQSVHRRSGPATVATPTEQDNAGPRRERYVRTVKHSNDRHSRAEAA